MHAADQGLELRFEADTDGTGELFASVACGPWSGAASAWFSAAQLQAFGGRLRDSYPLAPEAELLLQGGYWQRGAQPPLLQDVLLGLRVYPLGSSGRIGVQVELMDGCHEGQRPRSRAQLRVELRTEYQALHDFGAGLIELAKGEAPALRLQHSG